MSEDRRTFRIQFEDVSVAEAGQKVSGLRQDLLDISSEIDVEIMKDNPSTQDFGTTLILVLGTPAIIAIATGIAAYLKRVGGTVVITNGRTTIQNLSGADAVRIIEAMSSDK